MWVSEKISHFISVSQWSRGKHGVDKLSCGINEDNLKDKGNLKIKTTSKWRWPQNKDEFKYEEILKNEDNLTFLIPPFRVFGIFPYQRYDTTIGSVEVLYKHIAKLSPSPSPIKFDCTFCNHV